MIQTLTELLWANIVVDFPELMQELQDGCHVTHYLEERVATILPLMDQLEAAGHPSHAVEELCLKALLMELYPSRFNYLWNLMEEEFGEKMAAWAQAGLRQFELLQLLQHCAPVFAHFGFNRENEQHAEIYYAIRNAVQSYLINGQPGLSDQ